MTHGRGRTGTGAALAVGLAAAGSLLLPEPEALAGAWRLREPGGRDCRILLEAVPVPGGWRATGACLAQMAPGAEAWRPAPDGLALAAADGRTLVFLSQAGPGRYRSERPALELEREG